MAFINGVSSERFGVTATALPAHIRLPSPASTSHFCTLQTDTSERAHTNTHTYTTIWLKIAELNASLNNNNNNNKLITNSNNKREENKSDDDDDNDK